MGSLSDYLENELLDHLLETGAYTPATTLYLCLCTADPTDAGTGASISESTYAAYARQAIAFNAAASRKVENTSLISFPQAADAGGTITHWAICDALTNGNMLAHGALAVSKAIVSGNTPKVAANEVDIEFSAGYVSNYLALLFLDFAFRNQAFSQPNIHVALCAVDVADSDTGSTITEPGAGAYARVDYATWDTAASGASANTGVIQFPTPTASWGNITAVALLDAATTGNLLMYDNAITDQTPGIDDDVEFAAGDLDITLS